MDFDWMNILMTVGPVIVTLIFTYVKISGKVSNIIKEAVELAVVAGGALKDGKLTKEEIEMIIEEARDVKQAIVGIKVKEAEKS